jgi:tRNA nucleotidyltransferase (CCA-adding enzyme)
LDFDLVVEGDAIKLAESVRERFGGRVTSHSRFGTAKWFIDKHQLTILGSTKKLRESLPETLDFISARTEFYTHPTALPTVERGSIKLDLHRRDFTINTLALRLDGHHKGELYDYWGGLADLKGKLVKVLHSLSFVDDPTRILRAVRYEQRYDFQLDQRTQDLLLEAKGLLKRVSGDRIRHELDRIFDEKNAAQMMNRLHQLTILNAIHPDLDWDKSLLRLVKSLPEKEHPPEWKIELEGGGMPINRAIIYTVWLMRSPVDSGVSKRLKLVSFISEVIREASRLRGQLKGLYGLPPSQVTVELDRVSNLAIYAVYLEASEPKYKGVLSRYLSSWQHVVSNITGLDLKKAGLDPGPRYAEILSRVRNAWLDGEINSKKDEKALLKNLLAGNDQG